nr:MAG TPA: hypothetical protein [Caudoviricetes sp.]
MDNLVACSQSRVGTPTIVSFLRVVKYHTFLLYNDWSSVVF